MSYSCCKPDLEEAAIRICPDHTYPLVSRRKKLIVSWICVLYLLTPCYNAAMHFSMWLDLETDESVSDDEWWFIGFLVMIILVSFLGSCFYTAIGLYGISRKRYDCVMCFFIFSVSSRIDFIQE
ncbi:unnamed protein product, partial [Mesorhabditis belari]|uniref:Uncharacterized protein n=1 Tax=Mesorhabditis belari TaxID=2138241 RepID=A0AAF3EMC7_9BILA